MIVYRLCRAAYVALDGEGARRFGGRWNSPGRPVVYTAASPSLAVLEVLVHLDLPVGLLPIDYRLLAIDVPDDVPVRRLDPTPTEADACLAAGDAFLVDGDALVLQVRSIVVSQEWNALINVSHPDSHRIRTISSEAFAFDPRLL